MSSENITNIPTIFWEEKSKSPFRECKICTENLTDNNVEYVIEKAFKRNPKTKEMDVVFEYSICKTCISQIIEDYSKDTMKNLQKYFQLHLRQETMQLFGNEDSDKRIANCAFTGKSIEELDEYQISAFCQGDSIVYNESPIMMSGEAADEIQELISDETRQIMNGLKQILSPSVTDKMPVFI